ncbi:hypothetical protein Tco_1175815 [Tanacetum coccineum]
MLTHDPKSAKVSKGFESPNLQGKVNSSGSSIFTNTSPWMNADPFFPVLSSPRIYPTLRYTLEREIGLQELVLIEVKGEMSIGDLKLVGNGMRVAIEAIGSFDLILPSGLIIVLDNSHFAPSITRGVVSISRLLITGYALKSTVRILNMVPTKKVERTSYEIWHGKAPKFSYLRDTQKEMMGYYFYYPLENKIFVARNGEFFKNNLIVQEASRSHGPLESSGSDEGLELIQEEDTQPSENTSEEHNEVAHIAYELGDLDEPPNYKAALSDPESNKWLEARNMEMKSMKDN